MGAEDLKNMSTGDLEGLRERVDAELTRRELAEREPAPSRTVVEERPASSGTLRLEMVRCGKDRCKKCAAGEGHGPYWYLYYKKTNGRLTSKYIGKKLPDEPRTQEEEASQPGSGDSGDGPQKLPALPHVRAPKMNIAKLLNPPKVNIGEHLKARQEEYLEEPKRRLLPDKPGDQH